MCCFRCMFLQVFQMHVSSFSDACFKFFHVLHLNVLKVNRMLHLPPRLLLSRLGVSSSRRQLGIRRLLPLLSMLVRFGAARASCGHAKLREKRTASTGVRTSGQYQARIWDVSQGHEILGTTAHWPRRNKPYYENPIDRSVLESSPVHYEEIWLA